jgi:hypothetical protein
VAFLEQGNYGLTVSGEIYAGEGRCRGLRLPTLWLARVTLKLNLNSPT